MQRVVTCLFLMAIVLVAFAVEGSKPTSTGSAARDVLVGGESAEPKVRTFNLAYNVTLTDLPPNAMLGVWMPMPESNADQSVRLIETLLPTVAKHTRDKRYGNAMLTFDTVDAVAGVMSFGATWRVERREVRGLDAGDSEKLLASERDVFLAANKKVPVTGDHLKLIEDLQFGPDAISTARTLYERVDDHVTYDKSKPGYGNGDVAWVCDSRTGNCTDFHSLFISWARSKKLPARFEIGFPLPPERGSGTIGGYHCWAMFYTNDRGWVPVDISEADKHPEMKDYYFGNLTENRVGFSIGRDIVLEPKQAGPPLNYFVYPYIEVDGKPLGRDHIQLDFGFADIPPKN